MKTGVLPGLKVEDDGNCAVTMVVVQCPKFLLGVLHEFIMRLIFSFPIFSCSLQLIILENKDVLKECH